VLDPKIIEETASNLLRNKFKLEASVSVNVGDSEISGKVSGYGEGGSKIDPIVKVEYDDAIYVDGSYINNGEFQLSELRLVA